MSLAVFLRAVRRAVLTVAMLALAVPALAAQAPAPTVPPSIAEKTRGFQKLDGLVPLYWDAAAGKLWMEIPRLGDELLYVSSLPRGLGSNDIGLDRGQLGGERIVRFERFGPKVLLVEPNHRFRATGDDPAEHRAVAESFATSTLWGFRVEAETEGRVLVDATDFAVRDVHDVIGALSRSRQGTYRLDPSRSTVFPPNTKGFPRNTEIEVVLTFTGDNPGAWVRDVAPTPQALTVHQRHSFVALPEPGYTPRAADPRAGFFGVTFYDFSTPVGEPIARRFISRHRG